MIRSDELQPVNLRERKGFLARPVSQVGLSLDSVATPDLFERVRGIALRWISRRAGHPLPELAWKGHPFELEEIGAQRTAAVTLLEPNLYWAARLDDADKQVAQRTWVTEIGIGQHTPGELALGVRLVCVTRGEDVSYERSVPVLVWQAVEAFGASLEGRQLNRSPWLVSTEQDVQDLVALITGQSRECDVIVCALPEGSEDQADAIISPSNLHRRTIGAAHVVVLTGRASFYLTDRLGKEFSVFRGAVRTYRSRFDRIQDELFHHPLCLPERIAGWANGAQGFEDFLISQALLRSVSTGDLDRRLRPFLEVRQAAAQSKREFDRAQGATDKELLDLAWQEIDQLKNELEAERTEHDELLLEAQHEREQALEEAEQANARAYKLRVRNEFLEIKVESTSGEPEQVPIPSGLDGFSDWCQKYLAGYVDVHNRALHGVEGSRYQDSSLLYRALLLLRDHYVPMRRNGGSEAKRAYDEACARIGVKEEATFSGKRWGEEGDTYILRYAGRRRNLDRHLKKGDSRDPRYCFRLYFFWDDSAEQVVVGWLPSHLDTRVS